MKTKEQVLQSLKDNVKGIKDLIKDFNSWDVYDDDNWLSMVESLQDAIKIINKKPKKIKIGFSEQDLQELLQGKKHNWNFNGTEVKLYLEK